MMSGNLLAYFDDQFEKMVRNYRLAVDRHDPDGIHDYRVCSKRLKALFSLAECINPDFRAKKRFRRFRKLFKSSAVLRDMQIQMEIAGDLGQIPGFPHKEYAVFLRAEEQTAGERFDRFAGNFDVERLRRRRNTLEDALANVGAAKAEERARSHFRALLDDLIARVENPQRGDENMHGIRMLAKDVHYIREMLGERLAAPYGTDAFIGGIKQVHQALGKWHDYDIALIYFDQFAERGGSISDGRRDSVRVWIDEEKRKLMGAFETAWRGFRVLIRSAPTIP